MALTEKMLEMVKQYPVIYNLSDKNYRNIQKKEKVWDKMRLELGESGRLEYAYFPNLLSFSKCQ